MAASIKSTKSGKRLIPDIVDEHARDHPKQEAFQVPRSSDPSAGWKVITWENYANAVNHVAWRMVEICGHPESDSFPTVAYIGPNDARYVVFFVAAIKAGYQALFISPRNSQEGQINLFEKTDCHTICFPQSHHAMVQPWLEEKPDLKAVQVGELDSWFPSRSAAPFPYNKTYEQAEENADPVVVLHTSGSTGFPKPIVASVGMVSIGDAFRDLPDWQGTEYVWKKLFTNAKRMWLPMPLFHAAGLYSFINSVLFWGTPVALGVERPLSSDLIVECLLNVQADATLLPPAILEDMSQDETCTEALRKLKFVCFAGGNLGREAGNKLVSNGVNIVNCIAATEFCPWPYYYQTNAELWQYFIINSEVFGADWRKTDEEGVYEQVIVRQEEKPGLQGFFHTFPEKTEYYTNDLYKAHPDLPNHWIYYGRADNILVFSNGEKLNPVRIEEIVEGHPQVKGAVVVGSNRFQPALFVEPVSYPETEEAQRDFLDSVWSSVVQANTETVAHGQIGRGFVTMTSPNKPFPRAGKGTIQRAGAIKLYQDEIDQLYGKAGQVILSEAPRLDVSSEDTLVNSIQKLFETHLDSPHLESDTDFFSAGIDSMQVINATRLIRAGLEAAGHYTDGTSLATRVIYGNSTPRRLSQYLMKSVVSGASGENTLNEDHEQQQTMKQLHEKYTRELETAQKGRPEALDEGQTVILTGSTGMLGSYLLDLMITSPRVKKVVCLNRAEDGGLKQQAKAMESRGLNTHYQSKAEFHHVDISRNNFGLDEDLYDSLLNNTDRFIHNAWPVNFNITVETFEPHLRGVRNIADFAARAKKRVAVVFISSIASATRWDSAAKGPVPEQRLEDLSLAMGGYGRSKLVGSLILEDAAIAGDFPAAVVRMGQIAGPEADKGAWNRHEWFPSIIASSLYLGALPIDLGLLGSQVDWTPVERVASLLGEVAGITQRVDPRDVSGYYHGVNPKHTTWAELAPSVQKFYGRSRLPELVGFKEWVDRLEKSQSEGMKEMGTNPGIKLIDTYRGALEVAEAGGRPSLFDMQRTMGMSPAMRDSTAISPALLMHWCEQWAF